MNDCEAFVEYSNGMDDIYKNIEAYNPNKKYKILIVFDMIADMLNYKKLNPIILIFKTLWIYKKMYCKTIIFFSYWCYSCLR